MRFPNITSLYGRIFAIFWFTMLLVLIAVLALPHLDPRNVRDIPNDHWERLTSFKQSIEERFENKTNLNYILSELKSKHHRKDGPSVFLSDINGVLLSFSNNKDPRYRALQNFISTIDNMDKPQQKLYGRYLLSGPISIRLANQDLFMYVGIMSNMPPPLLLQFFDRPWRLLLAVMMVSTPLLLWLAWALSQPARKLEQAAQRVAAGEFIADPELEKGASEFRQAGASFNQMVFAVNQMVSGQQRLLSDISHELRSPLTRLRMANALATRKQGASPELERIDTEAQRLEQMINELLTLSRMQMDSHLARENLQLSSLWEDILIDAQFEAEQNGKNFHFSAIPECTITGNPKLLMSAVENVIRNAICYGKRQINVEITEQQRQLEIVVDDDGDGVPNDELDDIFRPFYRVSTARDRHSGGTGLGLAISDSAIRQHNGTIQASSSPLGGLRMSITLPLN